jgi:hypothetical protein
LSGYSSASSGKKAVKPPVRYAESPSEAESEGGSKSEEEINQGAEAEDETESDGPAQPAARGGRNKGPTQAEKGKGKAVESFQKRPKKVAGRKKLPRRLLDGFSSGEEEYSDDEQLEREGDVLERADEAAGPSTSSGLSWEPVQEGEDCSFIGPPEWKGGQSRIVRGAIGNLSLLNPLQIFLLLVPLSYWQMVAEQTNLYAEVSRAQATPTEKGKIRPWTPVSVQEVLKWLGIVLSMTLHPLPALSDYWRTGRAGNITFPDTGRIMSQNRFEQIKRYLHLNDNSQRPAEKGTREYRLWQLIPLCKLLNETFKKYYKLG